MLIMLKGVLEMDWWFLLMKDCVLKMHMEGYKALLWSSLVLLLSSSTSVSPAIGGPFLHLTPLPSAHLQPKQLLVTVMVFSLSFVVDCIIEVGKVRRAVLISCFLPRSRIRISFSQSLTFDVGSCIRGGWPGCGPAVPPPLKICHDSVPPTLSKTRSGDQGVGLPCAMQSQRSI